MSIQRFRLVRNVGRFLSHASAADNLRHKKLTLIYGENGIGKTTLTAILRSLASGQPMPITERRRLGTADAPHVIVEIEGEAAPSIFENGSWTRAYPDMLVFDDTFVNENVHSGLSVVATQRQNLHGLILGRDGVQLVQRIDALTERIGGLQTELRTKEERIGQPVRGGMSIDEFCALPAIPNVDDALAEAKRTLEAQEEANSVQTTGLFETLGLPLAEVDALEQVLTRNLADLDAAALASVQGHFATHGRGTETWVSEGMRLLGQSSECPFCAQDVAATTLVDHYRVYFSQAYADHKEAITSERSRILAGFDGDALAAFQRRMTTASERQRFWSRFAEVPLLNIDAEELARVWRAAREALSAAIGRKAAAPLETISLSSQERQSVSEYEALAALISERGRALVAANPALEQIKAITARGDVALARADVARLTASKQRYTTETAALCAEYVAARTAKEQAEQEKAAVRDELDRYRQRVIPLYEAAINERLRRFNADFRIVAVQATDPRGVPSSTYSLEINASRVPVGAADRPGAPSFKNTLSSGDRNTLALAFFFARLDREPNLTSTVVVIDDPITSLDDARSVVTAQEVRALTATTKQVIVLSHSKSLLCSVWEHADKTQCAALQVRRTPESTLQPWDVSDAAVTEYDRRHKLLRDYIGGRVEARDVRNVAQALRPVLEGFLRVSCPEHCPPGQLLGSFIDTARHANPRIVPDAVLTELNEIKEYANRFHHDTAPNWDREVENINEAQLRHFTDRVLTFVRVR